MRWDITGEGRAVSPVDWKQWDRIADAFNPTIVPPRYQCAPLTAEVVEKNGGHEGNARKWREIFWSNLRDARRATRKDFKSGAGLSPMPVYVATMNDGKQLRVTFWSRAGKPIDFASGFNIAMTIGRGIPVSGHVEHLGRTMSDPHFATIKEVSRKETPATRLKALQDAIRAGDFERAKQLAAA